MTEEKTDNPDSMWELLPGEIQQALRKAVAEKKETTRPVRGVIRLCPRCGERDTTDCDRVMGIEDVTIGLCLRCGYLWCLECETALLTSVLCGHWQVCAHCRERKDPSGCCSTVAWKCKHVRTWLSKSHPTV